MNLIVNGAPHDIDVDTERTLLSVLRDELGLTGAKYGCSEVCVTLGYRSPTYRQFMFECAER